MGGRVDVSFSNVEGGFDGEGNLHDDPVFVEGPVGAYYLSHIATGQLVNSPCIDAGSAMASERELDLMTTRVDEVGDDGVLDLGYHYPRVTGCDQIRRLRVACRPAGDRYKIVAKLVTRLPEGTVFTFELVGFRDRVKPVKSSGKATATWKARAPGVYNLSVRECPSVKGATSCEG